MSESRRQIDPAQYRREMQDPIVEKAMRNEDFKQRLVSDPKGAVAAELGQSLPGNVEVQVLQETENKVYIVLPAFVSPADAGNAGAKRELSNEEVEAIAGGPLGTCFFTSYATKSDCFEWGRCICLK